MAVSANTTLDSLDMARQFVASGVSVVPFTHGTKDLAYDRLPLIWNKTEQRAKPSWSPYRDRLPTDEELLAWFGDGSCNLAIVGGTISGGLVVLDFESSAAYDAWHRFATMLLDEALVAQFPVVRTGRGKHVYFRMPNPIGNRTLAKRPSGVDAKGKTIYELLAETRGEGGLALAPPSLHPSGTYYTLEQGGLTAVPLLTSDQAQTILDAARAIAEEEHPHTTPPTDKQSDHGSSVIDRFNHETSIQAMLEQYGYRQLGANRYIQPGGEHASVVINPDTNRSYHFNTADPLHQETPTGGLYGQAPFSVLCKLECGGDVRQAVKLAATRLGLPRRSQGAAATPSESPMTAMSNGYVAHAAAALGLTDDHPDGPTWPYFIEQGGMWMVQPPNKDGSPKLPLLLANFTAAITEEIEVSDGESQQERYTIVATCGTRTRTIELAREEFEGDGAMQRIVAALGARARLNPRAQAAFMRDAIKAFSTEVQSRTVYAHTGWVNDRTRFLFGNGYVDKDGWHADNGAQLPQRLHQYQLDTDRLAQTSMRAALQTFDDLLEIAPPQVTIPLIGALLLSPIAHTIAAPQPMCHLYGITGCHKTALCCAAMALWGYFSPAHPTDTWTSTANSIQRLGWHLKDAPMLLDDYKAAHVKPSQVTFLLQNYGDGMARGRLDANAEARNAFPIRATLLSSGEDQPEGEASALARVLSIPLARGEVNRAKLTAVQERAAALPTLLMAYLRWLATQPPELADNSQRHKVQRTDLLTRLEATMEQATNPGRIASNTAALAIAWQTFGTFLEQQGYWRCERVHAWLALCKQHLTRLAILQGGLVTEERASRLFLQAVRSLVASGRAVLQNLEAETQEMTTAQVLIGAFDRNGTYLMTPTVYDLVCEYKRKAGQTVSFSQRALAQMLEQDGLLVATDADGRHKAVLRYINGQRVRCWHLPPNMLAEI
jgi:hypothetical protein